VQYLQYNLPDFRKTPPNGLLPYLASRKWWDNTNINKQGFLQFGWDMFPTIIERKYGIAPWVYKASHKIFLWEPNMTKEDRCHVFATFRSGSKTTWFSLLLQLYNILIGQYGIYFNGEILPNVDYQVLKSKTGKEAKKRLLNIQHTMRYNNVKQLFGDLKPTWKEIKDREGKETADLLILKNGFIIEPLGMEQPSRGLNLLNKRPGFFNFDDPENSENTKTADRRKQNRREVMEESFGAVTDDGFIVYIGNKIHQDDTLGKLLKNDNWKSQFFVLSYKRTKTGKLIPGNGDLGEVPAWPKRYPMERIIKRKMFFESQPEMGGVRAFYKEYYNRIVSESEHHVKYAYFNFKQQHNLNWIEVTTKTGKEYRHVYTYVGNDPAISEKQQSSNAVIATIAVDHYKRMYILDISSGKYDIHDRFINENEPRPLLAQGEDLDKIRRIGSSEECLRKAIKYDAHGITIEQAGTQETFINETIQLRNDLGLSIPVLGYKLGTLSKADRVRVELMTHFEVGRVYIKSDLKHKDDLEDEINSFPFSGLDILDAINTAQQLVGTNYPPDIAYDPLVISSQADKRKESRSIYKAMDTHRGDPDHVEPWVL
jgi:hypothetical protein